MTDDQTKPKKKKTPRAPRLNVSVTAMDIETARPANSGHCMIAEAIKRAIGGDIKRVAVDLQTIRWSDPARGLRYTYLTPRPAVVNLVKWDQGVRVEPFQFRLRGAQVTTMWKGGPGKQKPVHNLGPKRLHSNQDEKAKGKIPDVIGGRPPSRLGMRREFGVRGLSLGEVFENETTVPAS
jgi:hypothetical protein